MRKIMRRREKSVLYVFVVVIRCLAQTLYYMDFEEYKPPSICLTIRGAPELGSGRLVPAGTPIFQSSGSGRN
jgi:hypothetical protein